jgi:hypothetical protein
MEKQRRPYRQYDDRNDHTKVIGNLRAISEHIYVHTKNTL